MKKQMFLGADRFVFQNAQSLRNTQTDAEIILWNSLKGSQLGEKFRRQHPLGIYIADFYCHKYKLVIELDGSIHNLPDVKKNDIIRQSHLESDGFKVLRFSNKQIFNQLNQVLNTIRQNLDQSAPSPADMGSPFRGRGGAR